MVGTARVHDGSVFAIGTTVRIQGLKDTPIHNGGEAVVRLWNEDHGCYEVDVLETSGAHVKYAFAVVAVGALGWWVAGEAAGEALSYSMLFIRFLRSISLCAAVGLAAAHVAGFGEKTKGKLSLLPENLDASSSSGSEDCTQFYKVVAELPGRKGTGVVARKDIVPGTVICVDYPLIVLTGDEIGVRDVRGLISGKNSDPSELRAHFDKGIALLRQKFEELSEDRKQQLAELHDVHTEELGLKIAKSLFEAQQKHCGVRSSFEELYAGSSPLPEGKSVGGIFETNSIPHGDHNAYGLFPIISRFNHSCVANAIYQWRESLGTNVVVATRDIKAGDEIDISYFKNFEMGRAERQEMTLSKFCFICRCTACVDANVSPDATRLQLRELNKNMETANSLSMGLETLAEMRQSYASAAILPNLVFELQMARDNLNLQVVYGELEDQRKATTDAFRLCVLLRGLKHPKTEMYRCWKNSTRGAPTQMEFNSSQQT